MLIIIPCGAKKFRVKSPVPAHRLYVGPYFKACLKYALSITDPCSIFILSAKYGLISLKENIESYDLKMGQVGSIGGDIILEQAIERDLVYRTPMIGLGGKLYTDKMRNIWPNGHYPLTGLSLGYSMRFLKINHGRKPWHHQQQEH